MFLKLEKKSCMKKRVLIIIIILISALFLTHPYVIYIAKIRIAAFSKLFESNGGLIIAHTNGSSFEDAALAFSEITNAVVLMSMLIDSQSECAIRSHCRHVARNKVSHSVPIFSLTDQCEMAGISRQKIRIRTANLLDKDKEIRNLAIEGIYYEKEFPGNQSCLMVENTWKRWGVEIKEPGPLTYEKQKELFPLGTEEQLLLTIVASHFKEILYAEVQTLLIKQAKLSENQYVKEIEELGHDGSTHEK